MVQKKPRVPVSERAIVQRVNRKLLQEEQRLATQRQDPTTGGYRWNELGHHYVIDTRRNAVVQQNVDLEELARELGALAPWETLAE